MDSIHGMKHGDVKKFALDDDGVGRASQEVTVSYHRRQSQGDNGKNVAGAYTGAYNVQYPGGRTQSFEHGPHATTEGARKRGANPNAKDYAARNAGEAVVSHLHAAKLGFNDRRV